MNSPKPPHNFPIRTGYVNFRHPSVPIYRNPCYFNQVALGAENMQLGEYWVAAIYFAGLRTVNEIDWKAAASFSLACLSLTII